MGCNTCGEQKPKKEACAFTKATVQINNPKELALFRKVVVPASLGDDTQYPPKVGKYCNVILYYEANDQVYLYSSDGIPTRITVDITELKKQIAKVAADLATEVENRETADQEIWTEIETIEAASDVVDVVGTYAELQQYDTSKLHDNDLIKVLQDETRDDAITYYRWNGSAFTYVGAEGPYYTASETDTLLAAKQDTLIAGANIQIATDGKTISATDTTYTHFTGATASTDGVQGLVPGPLAGDENKVLKGDGTWQDGYDRVALYITNMPADLTTPFYIYKDSSRQQPITWSEMRDLLKVSSGKEVVLWLNNSGDDIYHVVKYCDDTTEFYIVDPDATAYYYIQNNSGDSTQTQFSIESIELQRKLTAGSNITIDSTTNTISATGTSYSDFTGATSGTAGVHGLVPAPAAGDQDKVLKGDGTWGDAATATTFHIEAALGSATTIYKGVPGSGQVAASLQDFLDAFEAGNVIVKQAYDHTIKTFDNVSGGTYSPQGGFIEIREDNIVYKYVYTSSNDTSATVNTIRMQEKLTAGTNVTITGTTISATDTTYSDFTGTDGQAAGAAGLVPAPATTDDGKYLKADGTWATLTANNISSNDWSGLWQ